MKRRSLVVIAVAFPIGVVLSWAVGRLEAPRGGAAASPAAASGSDTQLLPARVICMSPAITEIVFALGQGDRVAGVSQWASYPPEASQKPKCGGFIDLNREMLLALRPDLVIMQGLGEQLTEFCNRNGIRVLSVELEDLESVFTTIGKIGRALGCEARAEVLCAEMRLELARVKAAVEDRPVVDVLLVTGRERGTLTNIQAVGSGGFLNDVVRLAGGRNVFDDLRRKYDVVNKESLLRRRPQVIIELIGEGELTQARREEIRTLWGGLSPLPAVQQGRVYAIGGTYAMVPGPRLVQLARELSHLLHGDN